MTSLFFDSMDLLLDSSLLDEFFAMIGVLLAILVVVFLFRRK